MAGPGMAGCVAEDCIESSNRLSTTGDSLTFFVSQYVPAICEGTHDYIQ